jgi:hypothetical protein
LEARVEQNGKQVQGEQETLFMVVTTQRLKACEEIFEFVHGVGAGKVKRAAKVLREGDGTQCELAQILEFVQEVFG